MRSAASEVVRASRRTQIIADAIAPSAATPRRRPIAFLQCVVRATLCWVLPLRHAINPAHAVIPLSPRAADAGIGRARRRVEQAGLDRPHRLREPARRRFPGRALRRQSQASPRARAALVRIARRDRQAGRPRADRGAGGGGRRGARGCRARRRQGGGHPVGAAARRRTKRGAGRRRCCAVAAARGIRAARPALVRRHPHRHRPQRDARATRSRTPGRLALVAQSGAVCAAMLDFAASVRHRLLDGGGAGRRDGRRLRRAARRAARSIRTPTASCSTSRRSATRGASCRRCAPRRGPSPSSC